MAKAQYVGVNDVARKVKQPYIGVNGVARKVKNGYVGVGGVARQYFSSGTPISKLSVGASVYMNVSGVRKEFIVVNQGLPSASYDSSCNGTWLLMKELYEKRVWDSSDNDYRNSDIHTYLGGTFLGLFDSGIRSIIKQVKIPYHSGTGTSGGVYVGAGGLSTKIFLLSGYEVGWTTSNSTRFPVDGACLTYFKGTAARDAKRIAYYKGTASLWWLRSPNKSNTTTACNVDVDGVYNYNYMCSSSQGMRPALVLPSEAVVDDQFNIIAS